jgi:hypothetical protein
MQNPEGYDQTYPVAQFIVLPPEKGMHVCPVQMNPLGHDGIELLPPGLIKIQAAPFQIYPERHLYKD